MQGILIALATAITLAIAGAFAAPFVVDWNDWRGTFERELGVALGMSVSIRGPIDAEILPAPRMVLRDVTLGDAASSGGAIQELDTELSLGGLLRGNLEVTGVTLMRPHLRLVLDHDGRIRLPAGAGLARDLRIAQMSVQNGRLEVQEQASGQSFLLDTLNLRGEARSLSGPFRLDGTLKAGTANFNLRSTLGELDKAGSGRLKLSLEGRGQPYDITLDGALKFPQSSPVFTGRATLRHLARRATDADGTEWQLSGDLVATPSSIEASRLDLGFGALSGMAQLSGTGRMTLGSHALLEAQLATRTFDLDSLGLPDGTFPAGSTAQTQPAAAPAMRVAALARHLVPLLATLPASGAPSRIALETEQLALGGAVLHDVKAEFTGSEAGWQVGKLQAQMPGDTTLTASARPNAPGATVPAEGFQSDILLTSLDPAAFLRWAAPDMPRVYSDMLPGPAHLETTLLTRPNHMALSALSARFGSARLSGDLSLDLDQNATPRIETTLDLEGFALDGLVPAAQNAALAAGALDATVSVSGRDLSFAGTSVSSLNIDATAKGGGVAITHLSVNTPGGLHMEGSGALDQATAPPRGSLRLAITGPSAEGLAPVAGILAGEDVASILARMKTGVAPVNLDTTLVWHGLEGYEARFSGDLGQISGAATFARDPGQQQADITLSAHTLQAGTLLGALNIPGLAAVARPAQIELKITPGPQDETAIAGRLDLDGLELRGEGIALRENDRLKPHLALHLKGDDLARLLPQMRTGAGTSLPTDLSFTLTALKPAWRLENLSGTLGAQPVSGDVEIIPGDAPQIGGKLAFESLNVPQILTLFAAQPGEKPSSDAPAPWSTSPFTAPQLPAATVDLKLSAPSITLLPPYAVKDGQMRLWVQQDVTEIRDLIGTLGGGRVSAGLRVQRRDENVLATGRVMLDSVDIAALTDPTATSTPKGTLSLSLDLASSGNSPLSVVQNLSGQGTITAQNLTLQAAAPEALASVLRQTEKLETPPDEQATARLLDAELAHGALTIPTLGSALGVSGGVIRLAPAHATLDALRISLGGTLDLAHLKLDARLDLEQPAGAWGVAGGSLVWSGNLDTPLRNVSALPLASTLSMRAIERETKRLEDERHEQEQARGERARNLREQEELRAQEQRQKLQEEQALELRRQQERIIRERQQAQPAVPLPPRTPRPPAATQPSTTRPAIAPLPAPKGIERMDLPAPPSNPSNRASATDAGAARSTGSSPNRSNSITPPAEIERRPLPAIRDFGDVPRPPGSIGLH